MKSHLSPLRATNSWRALLQKSILMILSVALLLWTAPARTHAADDGAPQKSASAKKPASAALATQKNDDEYTAKIKQFTTDPEFLTSLVDHMPASATVPTPEKVLGYIAGAENHLTYTKDLYRYYNALAKAAPSRVKVWTVGKSEEGRDFMMIAVTDEANIAQLDHFKDITAKLADPRKITDAEAQQLIKDGKPILLGIRLHPFPETGSPEMLMELAYRLAVDDSPLHPEHPQELDCPDHSVQRSRRPRPRCGRLQLSPRASRSARP